MTPSLTRLQLTRELTLDCAGARDIDTVIGNISGAGRIETAEVLYEWASSHEHPEGLCPFAVDGQPGMLVAYDTPHRRRRSGTKVTVDWLA